MPVKLNNKAGFIINCILNKCIDKKYVLFVKVSRRLKLLNQSICQVIGEKRLQSYQNVIIVKAQDILLRIFEE